MDSESENESIEGDLSELSVGRGQKKGGGEAAANWGKAKFDYYFTDYVDKDYPSSLSRKEEKLAWIEQEEAQRIQKKLFSNLDDINLQTVIDFEGTDAEANPNEAGTRSTSNHEDLIEFLEKRNKSILETKTNKSKSNSNKKKRVKFDLDQVGSDECEFDSENDEEEDEEDEDDDEDEVSRCETTDDGRKRRPINMAIKKNRGLTPYKKKEYRNPRVKHKLKYKKAMTKRRKLVKEAQTEFHRYSGEATGIKTSTVKSIKLC